MTGTAFFLCFSETSARVEVLGVSKTRRISPPPADSVQMKSNLCGIKLRFGTIFMLSAPSKKHLPILSNSWSDSFNGRWRGLQIGTQLFHRTVWKLGSDARSWQKGHHNCRVIFVNSRVLFVMDGASKLHNVEAYKRLKSHIHGVFNS